MASRRASASIPSATPIIKLDEDDELLYTQMVDDDQIKYQVGKKEKFIDTTKYKPKGRKSGGVKAIKKEFKLI